MNTAMQITGLVLRLVGIVLGLELACLLEMYIRLLRLN